MKLQSYCLVVICDRAQAVGVNESGRMLTTLPTAWPTTLREQYYGYGTEFYIGKSGQQAESYHTKSSDQFDQNKYKQNDSAKE